MQRTAYILLLIAFLDNLSVGILLPLIPLLITSPESNYYILPSSFSLEQGYILFGYLTAIYTIAQFFSAPLLGQLSDRYGRKPVLVYCLIGTALSYLAFGYGVIIQSLPLLFIARAFDGITGGNISVAHAAIADITPEKDRSKVFGLFGASLGLGFAIGPALGSVFSNSNLVSWFTAVMPFWVTAVLCVVSVLIIALFFKETHSAEKRSISFNLTQGLRDIAKALHLKNIRQLFLGIFLWRTGFAFYATFAAVFMIHRFGLNHEELGNFFLYTGAWFVFGQAVVTRLVAHRLSEERVVYMSIFIASALMFTYLIPNDWRDTFYIIPLFTAMMALTMANIPAVVSKAAEASRRGELLGINASVQALALSLSPIVSGYVSAQFDPVAIIISAGVVMVLAAIVLYFYARH